MASKAGDNEIGVCQEKRRRTTVGRVVIACSADATRFAQGLKRVVSGTRVFFTARGMTLTQREHGGWNYDEPLVIRYG